MLPSLCHRSKEDDRHSLRNTRLRPEVAGGCPVHLYHISDNIHLEAFHAISSIPFLSWPHYCRNYALDHAIASSMHHRLVETPSLPRQPYPFLLPPPLQFSLLKDPIILSELTGASSPASSSHIVLDASHEKTLEDQQFLGQDLASCYPKTSIDALNDDDRDGYVSPSFWSKS